MQDFLTASKLTPSDPLAFNNLGNVYEKLRDIDLAIENFDRASACSPTTPKPTTIAPMLMC